MLNKPARPFVEIKKFAKKFHLNFPTISDEDYFTEILGQNSWLDILKDGNVDMVLTVFWRLIDDDSKRSVRDCRLVKWNGINEEVVATDNPVERLKLIMSGDELFNAALAIGEARVKSLPEIKDNEKKNPTAAEH